jgi:hypothetical protein
MSINPLENPNYVPEHPPVNGLIPNVVARFGMRTQIRWFKRFWRQIDRTDLTAYHCQSEHHLGPCCTSCIGEYNDGYQGGGVMVDGYCCCHDDRIERLTWREE